MVEIQDFMRNILILLEEYREYTISKKIEDPLENCKCTISFCTLFIHKSIFT